MLSPIFVPLLFGKHILADRNNSFNYICRLTEKETRPSSSSLLCLCLCRLLFVLLNFSGKTKSFFCATLFLERRRNKKASKCGNFPPFCYQCCLLFRQVKFSWLKQKEKKKTSKVAVRTNGEEVKLNLIFYFKYPFHKNVKDFQHFCG